ncbi:MAG TPA: hypothetical protein VGH74_12980 [Planctomycetaceae bacterium]|jgi:hypothetical protein
MLTLCEERAQMMSVFADMICEETSHSDLHVNKVEAEKIQQQVEGLLDDCDLLSALWRRSIKNLAEQLAGDQRTDLRKLRDGAMIAIEKAILAYDATADEIQVARENDIISIRDGSLRIAIREARNIKKWIETWPNYDTGRRDRVLAEIAAGSPDADFSK